MYDADGTDTEFKFATDNALTIGDDQLLWVDVAWLDDENDAKALASLGITPKMIERATNLERAPLLDNYPDCFAFAVDAPDQGASTDNRKARTQLAMIVGDRWLVTIHAAPIAYLIAFTAQDKGETVIGKLSPSLLAASLLDWHLTEYFAEVADIEAGVDKIDEAILADGTQREVLERIVSSRARVSRLRAQLASQRPIFYGFVRPDFALNFDENRLEPFERLSARYDRAIDEVERTRDVIIGSFDLFTSMTTQQTNDLVKVLTFLTAVIGFCAAIAGLLGMNFELPFFKTGVAGFAEVAGGLVIFSVISFVVAKWQRWL
jgi:magnesium transporter